VNDLTELLYSWDVRKRWVDDLDLSVRAANIIQNYIYDNDDLNTFDQACRKSELFWLKIPGCGRKTAAEIIEALRNAKEVGEIYDFEWA
jgi:DNA-directed RNA polymerase alpha subunit